MLACFFRKYYYRDVTFSRPPIISRNSIFRNSVISFPTVAKRNVSNNAARFIPLRKNFTHKSLHTWRNLLRIVIPHFPDVLPASARIVIRTVRKTRRRRRRRRRRPVYFRIRTWVSQFCLLCLCRKTEKKRRVRGKTDETEGKEFLFLPEATPISIVPPRRKTQPFLVNI